MEIARAVRDRCPAAEFSQRWNPAGTAVYYCKDIAVSAH